jgi:hypothetical protein
MSVHDRLCKSEVDQTSTPDQQGVRRAAFTQVLLPKLEDLGVIRVRGSYEALENISNVTIKYLLSSPIMHSTYN